MPIMRLRLSCLLIFITLSAFINCDHPHHDTPQSEAAPRAASANDTIIQNDINRFLHDIVRYYERTHDTYQHDDNRWNQNFFSFLQHSINLSSEFFFPISRAQCVNEKLLSESDVFFVCCVVVIYEKLVNSKIITESDKREVNNRFEVKVWRFKSADHSTQHNKRENYSQWYDDNELCCADLLIASHAFLCMLEKKMLISHPLFSLLFLLFGVIF